MAIPGGIEANMADPEIHSIGDEENPYQAPRYTGLADQDPITFTERKINRQELRNAIRDALGQQVILLIFSALILDGGVIFGYVIQLFIISWLINLAIICFHFRGKPFDKIELAMIRIGFWPLILLVIILNAVFA
jgi:hypothetical protein